MFERPGDARFQHERWSGDVSSTLRECGWESRSQSLPGQQPLSPIQSIAPSFSSGTNRRSALSMAVFDDPGLRMSTEWPERRTLTPSDPLCSTRKATSCQISGIPTAPDQGATVTWFRLKSTEHRSEIIEFASNRFLTVSRGLARFLSPRGQSSSLSTPTSAPL